ncbi:MAG: phage terminase large subunit family protein [Phaeospirillum sp.]|nr:phage terminase large subunit family protein [Phaeospirillum sp.]
MRPDPRLTVSQWADQHRMLSSRASAEPGRYRTARTPYMRDIMDALSPTSPVQRVVFMKAAQVGATEAGCCFIGFVIHHAPGPMLCVQPTVEMAKRASRQRIDPLIEESPAIRERVKPARSRDAGNTMLSKDFPGGTLVLTGANSAVGLRSMPARYLFLDEVDAYPASADDEGDPVGLAEARSLTFAHRRKVFLASTPTIRGMSRIEREYEASDQRRFFVPCPHCGTMQWLKFERLRWDKGRPETVRYHCEACEQEIAEHHKGAMLAAGVWRATATGTDPGTIGFHISALYRLSPAALVAGDEGAETAVAVLLDAVDATDGAATGLIAARGPVIVADAALAFDASVDQPAERAAKITQLANVGLVARLTV